MYCIIVVICRTEKKTHLIHSPLKISVTSAMLKHDCK